MTSISNNILAIDAGNTRVKWGLFNATGRLTGHGACLNTELAGLRFPAAEQVVISNVAGNIIETQLKTLLANHANTHWVASQTEACGVKNSYPQPEKLGTDRWAALIAAWHIKQAPCVVVNAGTAVTIDALENATFNGGLIMPGIDLMQQSLYLGTAQLPIQNARKESTIDIFATSTNDAIYAGTHYAIVGAITLMVQELQKKTDKAPWILMSGGNATTIHRQLIQHDIGNVTNQAIIVDNLVLQGLYLLSLAKVNIKKDNNYAK
ncbi:MAG: type III pantothenate kinase [Methylotenera sp.]|nr:type III pantothenate kinase [Methylotenera sp.]